MTARYMPQDWVFGHRFFSRISTNLGLCPVLHETWALQMGIGEECNMWLVKMIMENLYNAFIWEHMSFSCTSCSKTFTHLQPDPVSLMSLGGCSWRCVWLVYMSVLKNAGYKQMCIICPSWVWTTRKLMSVHRNEHVCLEMPKPCTSHKTSTSCFFFTWLSSLPSSVLSQIDDDEVGRTTLAQEDF